MRSIHEILNTQYYKKSSWILLLLPISFIYYLIILIRGWAYNIGFCKTIKINVPVVVVGNINIGGTGKTPLVIWLLEKLLKIGLKPGLISRGYKSNANLPQEVFEDSDVINVGDEALMIKLRLGLPVFVGKRKTDVAKALLKSHPEINILISDDGLQHLKLFRDFEILVVDGVRKFGNNFLLPAGPLREGVSRIKEVDAVVLNDGKENFPSYPSYKMVCHGSKLVSCINNSNIRDADTFLDRDVIALTGIGNPESFFKQLTNTGMQFNKKIFNDHHLFTESDFQYFKDFNIVMTEKDAVKCKKFARSNFWYLPINADVDEKLFKKLIKKLRM